jgi:hypothetical protein
MTRKNERIVKVPPILSAVAWPTAPYAPGTAFVTPIYAPGTRIVPRYAWQSQIDAAADILAVQQMQVNEQEARKFDASERRRLRAEDIPSFRPVSHSPSSLSTRSPVSSSRMGMRIQKGWQQFQASTPKDRRLAAEAMAPMDEPDEAAVDTEKEAEAAVKKTRLRAGLLIGAAVGLFLALR